MSELENQELRAFFSNDTVFINRMLTQIRTVSENDSTTDTDSQQCSVWTTEVNSNGSHSVRVMFPGGKEPASLFFSKSRAHPDGLKRNLVCFLGDRKHCLDLESDLVKDCWAADALIVENLNSDVIVAYATGEVEPGGQWGNIVLFHEGHSADSNLMKNVAPLTDCNDSAARCPHAAENGDSGESAPVPAKEECSVTGHHHHRTAINDISPWYYDKVRIHRAEIAVHSWSADTNELLFGVTFLRTLSLRFQTVTVSLSDTSNSISESKYSVHTETSKQSVVTERHVFQW